MKMTVITLILAAMIVALPQHRIAFGREIQETAASGAVLKTLGDAVKGGNLIKLEKITRKGMTLYKATAVNPDGKTVELKVQEDGTLFELAFKNQCWKAMAWHEVPRRIQKAIAERARKNEIGSVRMAVRDGVAIYEARINNPDNKYIKMTVNEYGQLIGFQHKTDIIGAFTSDLIQPE